MSGRKVKQKQQALNRFLFYVLGHRPDEFGLFPDEEGFVPLKELLQALGEEDGWRSVRIRDIENMVREPGQSELELNGKLIRAAPGATQLTLGPYPVTPPPRFLYRAVRRKAYPVILDRGLTPGARPFIPLATDKDLALRIGKRRDANPVLITIQASDAEEKGTTFYRPQDLIYLVEALPPIFITGPPLPKEPPAREEKKKKPAVPVPPTTPGSFFLDPERMLHPHGEPPLESPKEKRKRSDIPDWKRATRKERRKKER